MSTTFEDYFAFLERLGRVLEELTEIAREKTGAVLTGRMSDLDKCMRREQALSLSLRSMDKKREQMLTELGLQGIPLSGLTAHCPEAHRLRAKAVTETLRRQFTCYQSAAEVARNTLECHLHQIERVEQAASGGAARTWTPSAGGVADIRA